MTSGVSAFFSLIGPCRLFDFSTKASFTRPSSSCTTTVTSTPTSSDTFPTPSTVDDGFYTCSQVPSLLQPLFSLLRAPVRATAYRLSLLYIEGAASSFLLSNDSKSPPVDCLFAKPQPLVDSSSAKSRSLFPDKNRASLLHPSPAPFSFEDSKIRVPLYDWRPRRWSGSPLA
ncbi:hypothetical protein GW17_00019917 [Ensete ventricosum]|nr:hypothetical protein GW17_00019917 [Ensete ventricosum]